jgi:multidrug efflux pump subunit AcrA (membrane-fusion protein)
MPIPTWPSCAHCKPPPTCPHHAQARQAAAGGAGHQPGAGRCRRGRPEEQAGAGGAAQALVDKKTIRAPFAGKLGITAVNPGQYLNPGDKLVTLQTIDTVYVDFFVPQSSWPACPSARS